MKNQIQNVKITMEQRSLGLREETDNPISANSVYNIFKNQIFLKLI